MGVEAALSPQSMEQLGKELLGRLVLEPLYQLGLHTFVGPNVVVEWLTLLLRIREAPGSNLGPEIGYSD
jgi:hypothetical protein